jgi:tRNA(Ile)-lysidine synthase
MMTEWFANQMESFSLPKGATLTVALSGGMDSVVLLHLLHRLPDKDFFLQAAHVEHGIRGESSLRDLEFCRRLCAALSVPLEICHVDAPGYAQSHGLSLEEAARELRYAFLDRFADGKMHFCATAHHREDQAETFFINLYRGSGSAGLSGIKPRRGGYLRPLLERSKRDLQTYAEEYSLEYVTDETNGDTAYLRNFLRHQVLPLLQNRAEGNFSEGLMAAMTCLASEDAALKQWADGIQTDRAEELGKLPDAVLKRVLDRQNGANLPRLHFEQVAELIRQCPPSGQIQLPAGRYFRLEYGRCVFTEPKEEPCIAIAPGGSAEWKQWKFALSLEEINKSFTHFQLDCDKIKGDLCFRHKQPGDRFLPAKGQGTSRLQKRLKNDRVPRTKREGLWVLADEQGNLLWAEGYGAAKEYAPNVATKRVYTVEIGKTKGD